MQKKPACSEPWTFNPPFPEHVILLSGCQSNRSAVNISQDLPASGCACLPLIVPKVGEASSHRSCQLLYYEVALSGQSHITPVRQTGVSWYNAPIPPHFWTSHYDARDAPHNNETPISRTAVRLIAVYSDCCNAGFIFLDRKGVVSFRPGSLCLSVHWEKYRFVMIISGPNGKLLSYRQ